MSVVYGQDKSLLTLPADMAGRRGPEAVTKFRRILGRASRRYPAYQEPTQAEREMVDAILANYYKPSKPTYRMFGGHVSFVGKVKHLSVGDMIDTLVVKAVEREMIRRGIGELWGTRLSDDLVDTARASLVKRDGPYDARTPDEAARYVVDSVIEAGKHDGASRDERIAYAVSRGW